MVASTKNRVEGAGALPADAVVGLIAGGGALPVDIAGRLLTEGVQSRVFPIEGEADADQKFSGLPREAIAIEDFGGLVALLRRHGVTHVLMAGTVKRRPKIASLRPHMGLVRVFIEVVWALARGDDSLLRAIINHIEKRGIRVISAQDILPELLVAEGQVAGPRLSKRDRADIVAAVEAAKAIGAIDVGQAAIAVGGRAIALEGIEGTDGLLTRMIELRDHGRLAGAKGGVLAKCAKPDQEMRADLPAVGPDTIDAAARAGLAGIALEAGRSLILDRDETLRRAENHGLFVFGLTPDGG